METICWLGDQLHTWKLKDNHIPIEYPHFLNGGGALQIPIFIRYLHSLEGHHFERAFEWCAGVGIIGLSLLQEGYFKHLTMADLSKQAIYYAENSLKGTALSNSVDCYHSDNFKSVPKEKYDLIFGNPPFYESYNKFYVRDKSQRNRGEDKNWHIHLDFFNHVSDYLNDDGHIIFTSYLPMEGPLKEEGRWPAIDERKKPPIEIWSKNFKKNDLQIVNIEEVEDITFNTQLTEDFAPTKSSFKGMHIIHLKKARR